MSYLIGTAVDTDGGELYSTAFKSEPVPSYVRIIQDTRTTANYDVKAGAQFEVPSSCGDNTNPSSDCNSLSLELKPILGLTDPLYVC